MKIIKCPVVSEIEINGEKFTSEFHCSTPVRFLCSDGEILYIPQNADEKEYNEKYNKIEL